MPLSATTGSYHLIGRAGFQRQPGTGKGIEYLDGLGRTTLGPAFEAAFDGELVDLAAGESESSALRVTNHAARAVTVDWTFNRTPATNPGFAVSPPTGTLTMAAGETASATVTASATADATGPNPRGARFDLTATAAGQPTTQAGSATLGVIWYPGAHQSLATTFNNKGITDDADPTTGAFDGGEASFSAQGLAAVGLTPGATVNHDGLTFTWPDATPGEPDNTATDGQVIALTGQGAKLGVLGSACCAPTGGQSGTVFVTYDDGSIVQIPLTFADWYVNDPAPGTEIFATVPWNVPPENPDQDHLVSIYYTALPLDSSKTVRFVTLPSNPNLHIFALAISQQ